LTCSGRKSGNRSTRIEYSEPAPVGDIFRCHEHLPHFLNNLRLQRFDSGNLLNGIDVVPATSDPSLNEWHYRVPDDDQWLYEFGGWDGDDRVKLLATSSETPTKHVAASVVRHDGAWHFMEPN
jgi:hypothetical protein